MNSMDQKQQKQVNEAAEKFAGAIKDSYQALADDLIEQQRKQQEASQSLAQEGVNAYMDFLNSMFSYYRGNLNEVQRQTKK